MLQGNVHKPRYTIAYQVKSKVWPYKDSYLRRFCALRARRIQRGGLFRRCVLVATTRKWTQSRRFIRPFTRRAGTSAGSSSKTAFGRPRKRLYRVSFYLKQQLRFFHGKRKESAFRQLFKQYQAIVGYSTSSFFSRLESRLDRFIFRRRLLPTIYACHQFIHHHGINVNNSLEYSPSAQVKVGDRVSRSIASWKPYFQDLFCRAYYRYWGFYVFQRRVYVQQKKKTFMNWRRKFSFKRENYSSSYNKVSKKKRKSEKLPYSYIQKKFRFIKSLKKNKKVSNFAKQTYSRLSFIQPAFTFLGVKVKVKAKHSSIIKQKNVLNFLYPRVFPEEVNSVLEQVIGEIAKNDTQGYNSFFQSVIAPTVIRPSRPTRLSKQEQVTTLFPFFVDKKILFMYSERLCSSNIIKKKIQHFYKLCLSLRLRKSLLPSLVSLSNNTKRAKPFVYKAFSRKSLSYFYIKRRKKIIRRRKFPRLKSVHYYIPSYIQIDFRTLRAVKIQIATVEDTFYPFRNSLAKIHSFFRSRGF